jgi:tRNA G18 (ribose-2'-O)-methylase SpoU
MRGYFGIGIYHGKTACNVGTLWRSAFQLGAAFIFTIGKRYKQQTSDTLKTSKHIPLYHYVTFDEFTANLPHDCQLVAVEIGGTPLPNFVHPQRCIYLLGAEDYGLPSNVLDFSQMHVEIPAVQYASYNVAVAGSLVMYDRFDKQHFR